MIPHCWLIWAVLSSAYPYTEYPDSWSRYPCLAMLLFYSWKNSHSKMSWLERKHGYHCTHNRSCYPWDSNQQSLHSISRLEQCREVDNRSTTRKNVCVPPNSISQRSEEGSQDKCSSHVCIPGNLLSICYSSISTTSNTKQIFTRQLLSFCITIPI